MGTEKAELNVVKQLFNGLTESEKKEFLVFLRSPDEGHSKIAQAMLEEPLERPSACPHCGAGYFVKNGHKDGRQRFLCRTCRKTFSYGANTILFSTKKSLEVWQKYIKCMIQKMPLRRSADECEVSLPTAFAWRHKILDALQNMMDGVTLEGIVEADETFFKVSYKGNHDNSSSFEMPRLPHKRGTPAGKRGLSNEQVCVPCGISLDGLSVSRISSLGKPSLKSLECVLGGKIAKGSVFVTDSLRPYQKLSADMELDHIRIPRNRHSVGTFNIQKLNNYHSQLKGMVMGTFNGVATKYLNNYLVYHNFVNYAKETEQEKRTMLFNFIRTTYCNSKTVDISKRPAVPLLV